MPHSEKAALYLYEGLPWEVFQIYIRGQCLFPNCLNFFWLNPNNKHFTSHSSGRWEAQVLDTEDLLARGLLPGSLMTVFNWKGIRKLLPGAYLIKTTDSSWSAPFSKVSTYKNYHTHVSNIWIFRNTFSLLKY